MAVYERNPKLMWRRERPAEAAARAMLEADDADTARAAELGTTIVVVGSAMHQLNLLGAEIWERLDGRTDEEEILEHLAATFDASREVLAEDLAAFLEDLSTQEWIRHVR